MENSTLDKISLVWGDSVAVRNAFIDATGERDIPSYWPKLSHMDYVPFVGNEELIEITKNVIGRQTGLNYKHVILTNGAAGAITIALRAYQQSGSKYCFTMNSPWFSIYPQMIKAAGLKHTPKNTWATDGDKPLLTGCRPVLLIDSPSNPLGQTISIAAQKKDDPLCPVIWDSVYYSAIYMTVKASAPTHDICVGSYSKLTGLNGVRIGWIATDDDLLFDKIKDLVTAEYCGLSQMDVQLLLTHLKYLDWDLFEMMARSNLDTNREQWSKLERFLGDTPVPLNGIFHYAPVDPLASKLFTKAGILWTPGSKLGHSDEYGRFNIGQSNSLIKKAVESVLKIDKLR